MYNRILKLITEIGDTREGKVKIAKAWRARKAQVEKAKRAMGANLDQFGKDSVSDVDTAKVIRGELQLSKVDQYMHGRAQGEKLTDDPKHKDRFGDIGAKIGMQAHSKVHKGSEEDIRRVFKGKLGTKGKGVKAATKNIQQTGQYLNVRNN